jgi:large subunit ribosomal protein L21
MFAIVDIAGFQEKVEQGMNLEVPLLQSEDGSNMIFEKVLLVSDGDTVTIGSPYVAGASVEVKILSHGKGDKIRIQKAHRRKRYRRVAGHRQQFTKVEVMSIKY